MNDPQTRARFLESKNDFSDQFRLRKINDFRKTLNAVIALHKAIIRYKLYFKGHVKGLQLQFRYAYEDGGQVTTRIYTEEHVKLAERMFEESVKNLFYYVRVRGSKKKGAKLQPNSFRTAYKPVFIPDGPLIQWFLTETINVPVAANNPGVNTNAVEDLWDVAVRASGGIATVAPNGQTSAYPYYARGYLLSQTVENIFYIATELLGLKQKPAPAGPGARFIVPTPAMTAAFSQKANYRDVFTRTADGKIAYSRVPNNDPNFSFFDAVQDHVNMKNAYAREVDPTKIKVDFDRGMFTLHNSKVFSSLSTALVDETPGREVDDLSLPSPTPGMTARDFLADEGNRQAMLEEFLAIEKVNKYNSAQKALRLQYNKSLTSVPKPGLVLV